MKNTDMPLLTRIKRVEYHLKNTKYCVGNQETEDYVKGTDKIPFAKPVWAVARALNDAHVDACFLKKPQLLAWAEHVLCGGPRPADTPVEAAPAEKSEAEPAEEAEAKQPEYTSKTINVPVRVAIYTLLVSARELTRMDHKPGAADLGKLIDKASEAYLDTLNTCQLATAAAQPAAEQPTEVLHAIEAERPVVPNPIA